MKSSRRSFMKQMGAAIISASLESKSYSSIGSTEEQEVESRFQPNLIDLKNMNFTQVLIVGSGYGSSVTALRMAEAGRSSVILEMGKLWNKKGKNGKVFCNPMFPDERAIWLQNKTTSPFKNFYGIPTEMKVPVGTGIIDIMRFNGMDACMARGVGGGSLVNMAMLVRASQSNVQRFLPTSELNSFFSHYYPLAENMLEANSISPDFYNRTKYYKYSRIAQRHFRNAGFASNLISSGYDFKYLEKEARGEVPKSALNYEVSYGNNYGKKSLDKTYLLKAFATGRVQLAPLTQVKTVSRLNNENYLVEYIQRDESTGSIIYQGRIECQYLFLGAGSLGTTELLLRSKQQGLLPNVSEAVGNGWGNNSEVYVAQNNSLRDTTGLVQATVPTGASVAQDQDREGVFVMHLPMPVPIPNYYSLHIAMTEADAKTRVHFDSNSDRLTLNWGEEQSRPIERKAQHIFDLVNSKNQVQYNKTIFNNNKAFFTNSAYHLMGGCRLNEATNEYGELLNYKNLFVMDASLLPHCIGVNPALTITALAERNIDMILNRLEVTN